MQLQVPVFLVFGLLRFRLSRVPNTLPNRLLIRLGRRLGLGRLLWFRRRGRSGAGAGVKLLEPPPGPVGLDSKTFFQFGKPFFQSRLHHHRLVFDR